MSLYKRYLESKSAEVNEKVEVINEIISTYPKIIDYLYNRLDTCFGEHTVYLVHMKVNGEDMLKIGYTKNSVKSRFSETRYAGRNNLEIVEILRQDEFQAKGAIDFEKNLKNEYVNFKVTTDLTLPGKGEFYSINYRENILEKYDLLSGKYKNTFGLKSPN